MTTTYEIDGRSYTAAEILDDPEFLARGKAIGHAKLYSEGCRIAGHHCEACLERLGQEAHPIESRKVGARRGYKGHWEHRCKLQVCPERNAL